MPQPTLSILAGALFRLLRPLARICLRNGLSYGAFAEVAKRVFVEVAMDEFGLPGRKQSISRVSVITGLSRKEVSRVRELPLPDDTDATDRYNRAARVISGWIRDPEFVEPAGGPTHLPFEGRTKSFTTLVKRYSGDIPPRAILDELVRVGSAERLDDGTLRLLRRAYLPESRETDMLPILGTDVADLITTIDHNLRATPGETFLQRKVAYDNLPTHALVELRSVAARNGQLVLEELDEWLARHDRDVTPTVEGPGRMRAGVGIYYFEEAPPQEN